MEHRFVKLNLKKTRKAFTLLELLVSVVIITLLSLVSVVIFELQRDQVKNLENATSVLKDAILSTQNLAFSPRDLDTQYYVFALNLSSDTAETYGTYELKPKHYAIFSSSDPAEPTEKVIKEAAFNQKVVFSSANPIRVSSNVFNIWFRVNDGIPGFGGLFPEDADWNNLWTGTGANYADVKVTEPSSSFEKDIKIQKLTGGVNVQ